MKDKISLSPTPIGAEGDDVTTWALPEGAIARLGRGGDVNLTSSFHLMGSILLSATPSDSGYMISQRYPQSHSGRQNAAWLVPSPFHITVNGLPQAIQIEFLKCWMSRMARA